MNGEMPRNPSYTPLTYAAYYGGGYEVALPPLIAKGLLFFFCLKNECFFIIIITEIRAELRSKTQKHDRVFATVVRKKKTTEN